MHGKVLGFCACDMISRTFIRVKKIMRNQAKANLQVCGEAAYRRMGLKLEVFPSSASLSKRAFAPFRLLPQLAQQTGAKRTTQQLSPHPASTDSSISRPSSCSQKTLQWLLLAIQVEDKSQKICSDW